MRPRGWIHALAAAALLLGLSATYSQAQNVDLDHDTAVELAALPILRGPSLDPQALQTRPTIVAFFASWCAPCRAGFVEFRKLIEQAGADNLTVIAVNWLEDAGHYPGESFRLQRLLDRVAPHITVLEGNDEISARFGGVDILPTLFVFDQAGNESFRFVYDGVSPPSHPDAAELFEALVAHR